MNKNAYMDGYLFKEASDEAIRTILSEARGQGPVEMKLVADVIANRAARRKLTPRQVVLQPKQFSVWNDPSSRNYKSTMAIKTSDPMYLRAKQLLQARLRGQSKDWTGGATHFYNPKVVSPKWGGPNFKSIRGSTHVFGKAK